MANKVGRPSKHYDVSRHPGISIRLTLYEEGQLIPAVKRSGLSKSEWARKALLYVVQSGIRIT